jgi:SAM-dependent methyltransferase
MLNDILIDEKYTEKNIRRMNYFIPNYLLKFLKNNDIICSVGCGTGYDVELLNNLGFDAYGLDPGSRISEWKNRPINIQKKLKVGFVEDFPFGKKKFDFIYALEVIEHVGCKNGIWELLDNFLEMRVRFLKNCLETLKPNGNLLITTSNRLFPIDFGHAHHYNKLTNYFSKYGLNFTIPWHRYNFVLSFGDICKLLDRCKYSGEFKIKQVSAYNYPSNSNRTQNFAFRYLLKNILILFSIYPIKRLNPILVVLIKKQ